MIEKPKVYLAGPMNEGGHELPFSPAPWRVGLTKFLVRAGIDVLIPEHAECNHNGMNWPNTVEFDLSCVRIADAVYAYINKPDRDGTVCEIACASGCDTPVVVFDRTKTLSGFVAFLPNVSVWFPPKPRSGRYWPREWMGPLAELSYLAWNRWSTPLEDAFLMGLRNYIPKFNVPVFPQFPVGPWRVDFLLPGKVVIECDGNTYHESRESMQRDKYRDRWMIERGFVTLRFPTESLSDDKISTSILQVHKTLLNRWPVYESLAPSYR